jgi:membrane fusion protein (multidrug efflux system)
VAQARLNLSWTQVRAPVAGILSGLELRPGSTVASGQPLFALVDTSTWWINANFKETDLRHIEPGRPADITVDMYPGKHFHGVVDSISPASGSAFSLLPPENATGNWVKVTQRIPVRVRVLDPDPAHPLRIGASSSVTVDARGEVSGAPGQP